LTLIDVLSGLDHVEICTAYRYRGARLGCFRADIDTLSDVEPVYETLPAWRGNITGCRRFEELPPEAQQYINRVEKLIGAPIRMISVGAERSATIMR
jgi:adenylosuccinate synthase